MKKILFIYIISKKLIFVVLLLMVYLINYNLSYSQSSYTLHSTSSYLFYSKEANKIIKALQTDSVHFTNGDSVFYLHPNILTTQSDSDYCLQLKYNLFSKKVIKKTSGNLIFFNQRQDSIFINTQSPLGSEWIFYKDTSTRYFKAKIISVDTMTLLPGIIDSVKIINLTCVNGNTNCIFTEPIIISKNFGFVNLYPLFYFPNIERASESDYILYNNIFEFIGEKNPNIGLYHLDAFDIYNYDVGDEFHTGSYSSDINPPAYVNIWSRNEVNIITEKKINSTNDSIFYKIKRCTIFIHNKDTSYFKDTTKYIITKEASFLNNYPNDYKLTDYGLDYIKYVYDNFLGLPAIVRGHPGFNQTNDSLTCFSGRVVCGPCAVMDLYYFPGLGGAYYDCYEFVSSFSNSLIYFKKANQIWGTPLNTCDLITSNETKPLPINKFSIFPNPAQNIIQINSQSGNEAYSSIQMFDYTGKLMLIKKHSNQKTTEIDITGLTEGYYYVIIKDTDGKKQFEKFVKIK